MEKTFTNCPACGSSERFCESLAKELIDRGLARKEWTFTFDTRQGVAIDPTKEPSIPIGSEVSGYLIKTDICLKCGCMYAIELKTAPVKKTLPIPSISPINLNRAQRRHPDIFPSKNNPALS